MQQWLILSNEVNYIQYDRHPKNFYNLSITAVNKEKYKRRFDAEEEKQILRVRFWGYIREIKGRIFRYIQWNSIRNIEYH